MNTKEIIESALTGNAILFLGRDILLASFICDIFSVDLCLDDIEMILDKRIISIFFEECEEMKELVLINNNKVKIKSSSVATHIITNRATQYDSEPLRTFLLGGFLYYL